MSAALVHSGLDEPTAAGDDPGHVRQHPVGAVRGAGEVVDEDVPADADLVAQQPGVGELGVQRVVRPDPLTRMRLAGVDEDPIEVGTAVGRVVEQRTLCGAVRSGERSELQHQRALSSPVRQSRGRTIVQA